jgi:hypothetical protein
VTLSLQKTSPLVLSALLILLVSGAPPIQATPQSTSKGIETKCRAPVILCVSEWEGGYVVEKSARGESYSKLWTADELRTHLPGWLAKRRTRGVAIGQIRSGEIPEEWVRELWEIAEEAGAECFRVVSFIELVDLADEEPE